jgi:succinyl-diaminopimelate desuccinylase
MHSRSVALTQELVRFPSVNPPGEEAGCIDYVTNLLTAAGVAVETHAFAPGRPSIVARIPGTGADAPLCFTGHVDVVPLGAERWTVAPFGGDIADGKLFGRGSSDMKAGVAAFVAASLAELGARPTLRRGITLVITAGEETGCEGAFHLARNNTLGNAALLIVAEPTSNRPIIAHKGSLRLNVRVRGRTAHSSMPQLGDNAIEKAADVIHRLRSWRPGLSEHPLLGAMTAAVTTISGGLNINSVPDHASFTIDVRTLPRQHHRELVAEVKALCGLDADVDIVTDFAGFETSPENAAVRPLWDILREQSGEAPHLTGAPYFTDASALVPAFGGVPAVVIGPGEAAQCHRTDEFCFVEEIDRSCSIYRRLIAKMCG